MRIVVLEGSPNKKGSSNLLADEFIRGAEEAGHTVETIDAAHADLHPCIGSACAVDMKAHASRRMIWSGFGNRS